MGFVKAHEDDADEAIGVGAALIFGLPRPSWASTIDGVSVRFRRVCFASGRRRACLIAANVVRQRISAPTEY